MNKAPLKPKSRKGNKPLEVIKEGSISIPVYAHTNIIPQRDPQTGAIMYQTLPDGNRKALVKYQSQIYTVAYYSGSKRVRRKFSDLNEARQEARLAAVKLTNGETEALKLTGGDRADYVRAMQKLREWKSNADLLSSVTDYTNAARRLPENVTLKEAVEFYLKRHPIPLPITTDTPWNQTPQLFREQFRVAYSPTFEFGEIGSRLKEHVMPLRLVAKKLAAGDKLGEREIIAEYLFSFANELGELVEFNKVFNIPKSRYSEKQFAEHLGCIRKKFKDENLLIPTKQYDTHASYQGTDQDWIWFLIYENLGLDLSKSADVLKLSQLYSEDLRQRAMRGKAPRFAKAHGFTGSKIPSKVLKNRRNVIKQHVRSIQGWIDKAFPER